MREKIMTLIGQLLFATSYMALGLMALSLHFSSTDLLCVALPFILIDTSQPLFKVKSADHKLLWTFLSMMVLLPLTQIAQIDTERMLFCMVLIFLLWGYFGSILLGQNRSVVIVAMNGMRVLIIVLPYIFPEMKWGVMEQSAVKDAVVVSILIDSLIDKCKKVIERHVYLLKNEPQ